MARKIKVKGPQQITVLSRELAVLRKLDFSLVNPNVAEMIALTQLEPDVAESDMAWFEFGYVANDHARSEIITREIMDNTLGFAVARTDTGEILYEFTGPDAMIRAERAVAGAKTKLAIDVDLDIDDDEVEPEAYEGEPQVASDVTEDAPATADAQA